MSLHQNRACLVRSATSLLGIGAAVAAGVAGTAGTSYAAVPGSTAAAPTTLAPPPLVPGADPTPATPGVATPGLTLPAAESTTPENLLADPAWRDLFAKLAPNKTRQSAFEERRYFPFRKTPTVLQGEIRIVPELGLSLRYLEPEARLLIVDGKGLLMRDVDGRERAAPADSRAQAATGALVNVLRFDLAALHKEFELQARRDGAKWTLMFVPRDPNFANLLGTLSVSGEEAALQKIEMVKSPTQRIEILIRDTREDVVFTGDTLRRFFR